MRKPGAVANCGCFQGGTKNRGHSRNLTHGMTNTRLYGVWAAMIDRCRNPKNKRFEDYGGRGIAVCAAWFDAATFLSWALANGYRQGLQLDRIDNNRGYEPDNCRFITPIRNMANRRTSARFKFGDQEMTISEAARHFNVNRATLDDRIQRIGMDPLEAATCGQLKVGPKFKS